MGSWLFHERLTKTIRIFFFSWAVAGGQKNRTDRTNETNRARGSLTLVIKCLLFDFYDRGTDAVDGRFAVGGEIVAPRRVEIADVSGGFDKNHRGGELKWSLAVVFLDIENSAVRLDKYARVAFVGGDPDIALRIEGRAVSAFE